MNFIFEERRTQRVRSSNPEGFDLEPSGFHEPRRVRRTNPPGFDIHRTQEGSIFEPCWVRGTQRVRSRTQKGSKIRTLLGLWNPEGFEDTNPEGFDLRTLLGSIFEPSGFDLEPRGFVLRR
ncbi:hypothetical protein ACOSP7_004770 [Xanthoceras sorbifolium]